MGTGQSKAKEKSASPAKEKSASPKKEKSASPKKEKRKSVENTENQNETASVQNGEHAVGPEEGTGNAVARRNGTATEKKTKKRTSFYETVDASEVLPYLIIGNLASSKDDEFLARKNVKFILNLIPESEEPEGMEYKNVPLEDDDDQELFPYLDSCFDFINKVAGQWKSDSDNKGTILVNSYFGMSRSASVVIAYLMKEKKWSLREAYDHLKERHSSINPNDNFAVQLIRYEQEMFERPRTMSVTDFRH